MAPISIGVNSGSGLTSSTSLLIRLTATICGNFSSSWQFMIISIYLLLCIVNVTTIRFSHRSTFRCPSSDCPAGLLVDRGSIRIRCCFPLVARCPAPFWSPVDRHQSPGGNPAGCSPWRLVPGVRRPVHFPNTECRVPSAAILVPGVRCPLPEPLRLTISFRADMFRREVVYDPVSGCKGSG